MGLKDLIPKPQVLEFPTGTLTLYPLTMKDIIFLLQDYSQDMNAMMEGKVDIAKLIAESPSFVANVIIYSSRESDVTIEDVASLPFAVQLSALQAIWDLSAVDGDMLGKLFLRVAEGITKLNNALREQSVKQMLNVTGSTGT